jgi:hypothetical protein
VEIITVLHEREDGWHKFTSPEIPGFYMIVEPSDLGGAYDDIPRAIEALILADSGAHVSIRPEKTFSEYLASLPTSHQPATRHYSVERRAA